MHAQLTVLVFLAAGELSTALSSSSTERLWQMYYQMHYSGQLCRLKETAVLHVTTTNDFQIYCVWS